MSFSEARATIVSATDTIAAAPATDGPATLFSDVKEADWFYHEVATLTGNGILTGYADRTFRPHRATARSELAALLARALALKPVPADGFADIRDGDWYAGFIGALADAGVMNGTGPDTFSPAKPLTREQAAAVMVRARSLDTTLSSDEQARWLQGFKDRRSISAWARPYVASAVRYGLVKGYPNGEFRPTADLTRAETAAVLWAVLASEPEPAATHPAYVDPYPLRPVITNLRMNEVIYRGKKELTVKVDAEASSHELWVNGKLVDVIEQAGVSKLSFGLDLPFQRHHIGVVSKNASGRSASQTITCYAFNAPPEYTRLIIIDKSEFHLYWIVDGAVKKIYDIAIGKDGTPTPIATWIVGQKLVEDPDGVFGPRRLRLYIYANGKYNYTGYGIHGTNEPWVIGSKASHGCIRLRNEHILELWPQVDIGDHVLTQQ